MATAAEFLSIAQELEEYLLAPRLSEADTRVHLVDPILRLLGYRGLKDMRREVPIPASREFIDYELRVAEQPIAIVEAKALRYAITDQDAAQCVQYASVLGAPWCLITNGIEWHLYYAYAIGSLTAKKVAQVRLQGDEQTVTEAWRVLSLIAKDSLTRTNPLVHLLVERVVIDELARPDSPAVIALRKATRDRFREQVSAQAVLDVIQRLLGPAIAEIRTGGTPTKQISFPDDPAMAKTSKNVLRKHQPDPESTKRSDLHRLQDAGLLPEEATLEFTVYGVTHTARVRQGRIEMEGASYDSPSAAASALRGGKAANGWTSWKYKGTYLSALQAQLAGANASADTA